MRSWRACDCLWSWQRWWSASAAPNTSWGRVLSMSWSCLGWASLASLLGVREPCARTAHVGSWVVDVRWFRWSYQRTSASTVRWYRTRRRSVDGLAPVASVRHWWTPAATSKSSRRLRGLWGEGGSSATRDVPADAVGREILTRYVPPGPANNSV